MLKNTRIVLVEPHFSGNVGSTARVMKNFGIEQLCLVRPYAHHLNDESRRLSTHGESILESAKVFNHIEEAVADCSIVLATSGHVDGIYRIHNYGRPDELLAPVAEALKANQCALVFGPEPSGLSKYETSKCHGIIRILTEPEYPSLNLAQSVGVILYELHRQWLLAQDTANKPTQKIATYEEMERMFGSLAQALEEIHFLWGTKGDLLMHGVRHLIARSKPSPNEVRILFGLARQILYVARNGVPLGDAQVTADAQWPEIEAELRKNLPHD